MRGGVVARVRMRSTVKFEDVSGGIVGYIPKEEERVDINEKIVRQNRVTFGPEVLIRRDAQMRNMVKEAFNRLATSLLFQLDQIEPPKDDATYKLRAAVTLEFEYDPEFAVDGK